MKKEKASMDKVIFWDFQGTLAHIEYMRLQKKGLVSLNICG